MAAFVFDACALIALADDEAGADILESYIANEENDCYVHSINLCEVYYQAHRRSSEAEAVKLIEEFLEIGFMERSDMDTSFWHSVGNLKSVYRRISIADCCAVALTIRLGAELLTSDHHELDILAERAECPVVFFR